jgi:hypothetical protein
MNLTVTYTVKVKFIIENLFLWWKNFAVKFLQTFQNLKIRRILMCCQFVFDFFYLILTDWTLLISQRCSENPAIFIYSLSFHVNSIKKSILSLSFRYKNYKIMKKIKIFTEFRSNYLKIGLFFNSVDSTGFEESIKIKQS